MPFRKARAKISFLAKETGSGYSEPLDFPNLPSTCTAGTCRKKKLWDQLSIFSSQASVNGTNHTRPRERKTPTNSAESARNNGEEELPHDLIELGKTPSQEEFDIVSKNTIPFTSQLTADFLETPDMIDDSVNEDDIVHEMANMTIQNNFLYADKKEEQTVPSGEDVIPGNLKNGQSDDSYGNETKDNESLGPVRAINDEFMESTNEVGVKIKYGGYIMAGFSSEHRSFSPSDVEYMKLCVKALESLFACD